MCISQVSIRQFQIEVDNWILMEENVNLPKAKEEYEMTSIDAEGLCRCTDYTITFDFGMCFYI